MSGTKVAPDELKRTYLRMTPEEHKEMRITAIRLGMTSEGLIAEAIRQFVKNAEPAAAAG